MQEIQKDSVPDKTLGKDLTPVSSFSGDTRTVLVTKRNDLNQIWIVFSISCLGEGYLEVGPSTPLLATWFQKSKLYLCRREEEQYGYLLTAVRPDQDYQQELLIKNRSTGRVYIRALPMDPSPTCLSEDCIIKNIELYFILTVGSQESLNPAPPAQPSLSSRRHMRPSFGSFALIFLLVAVFGTCFFIALYYLLRGLMRTHQVPPVPFDMRMSEMNSTRNEEAGEGEGEEDIEPQYMFPDESKIEPRKYKRAVLRRLVGLDYGTCGEKK